MKRSTFFAFAAAFALTACNTTAPAESTSSTQENEITQSSDIAIINIDRVLAESDIYTSEGVALQDKTQKAQAAWAKKEQGFQYEASQLQEKYQKGLITTSNAQKQQTSIESRIKSYQTSVQKEAASLEEESVVFSNRAQDLLRRAIEELNADKKYKMILNASALIDADTTLDQSVAVLEIVNRLYASEKAE